MQVVEDFLSAKEEQEIIAAIQAAERNTSGEIRVHIEAKAVKDHYKRAVKIFSYLKMHKTKARNGMLLYISVLDKKFVIYGDKGINEVVEDDFWEATKNSIQTHFQKGAFKAGITTGIEVAGKALKRYFPYQKEDVDELSNEISKG
jgi:uncharacterized membrane protein